MSLNIIQTTQIHFSDSWCFEWQDDYPLQGEAVLTLEPSDWLTSASAHLFSSFLGLSFPLVLQSCFRETLLPRSTRTHVLRRLLLMLTHTNEHVYTSTGVWNTQLEYFSVSSCWFLKYFSKCLNSLFKVFFKWSLWYLTLAVRIKLCEWTALTEMHLGRCSFISTAWTELFRSELNLCLMNCKPAQICFLTSLALGVAGRCLSAGGRYACVGGACVVPSSLGAAWYLMARSGKLPSGNDCQRTSHSSEPGVTSHLCSTEPV